MTKLNRRLALGVSAATLLSAQAAPAARPFAGAVFTPERLERAKVNFRQYPWVQDRAAELGRTVAPLLQLSLRELWELVPGPNLGRTIDVVMTRDAQAQTTRRKPCPSCGVDGGYAVRPQSGRFTVFCSACGDRFPKNDFGSVYRTARGGDGFFDPQAIDRRLLVPRSLASDGSSLPIVDDGSGWPDDTGFVFRFVPFAVDQLWNVLINGARNLADYWALSGDAEGARRAAVIIDRVADCYPDMDWAPLAKKGWYHSDGDSGRGKIFGRISESRVLPNLVQAYDQTLAFVGSDKELHTFFKEQAASWSLPTEKGSGELYRKAVEERLLRTGLKAIQEERIRGNHGMHEFAAAWCAVALQHEAETQQWLDWVFSESGLQVPNTILGHMDRDGLGNEGAPAYAWGWGFAFHELAELLRRYGRYDRWVLQRDFIPFRRSYTAPYRMTLPDGRVPTLGDFGSCMEFAGPRTDTHHLFEGFRLTEDPAIAAEIAKLSPEFDVCRDPFDENPAAWPERLQTAAEQTLPTAAGGQFLPGFGLATLDLAGAQGNTAVWLAFGRNRGHGHPDSLNLGLVSHGVDLLPDIGYPDFATRNYAKRADWTSNTISHNTVVVDGQRQPGIWSGRVRHYKRLPQLGLGLMEVDSPTYAQTSLYRRSVVLLQRPDGGSYCWDLFRVQGGSEHIQSWHGPEGDVNLPANAEKRPSTLDLREATPYLTAPTDLVAPADEPLKLRYLSHPRWRTDGTQVGLQWMALNDSQLSATHAVNPKPSLRTRAEQLDYLFLHGTAGSNPTLFSTLLVPDKADATPLDARRLALDAESGAVAIRVELGDGWSDTLVSCVDGEQPFRWAPGYSLEGGMAWIRRRNDTLHSAFLCGGAALTLPEGRLTASAEWAGTIEELSTDRHGHLWVACRSANPLPADLRGEIVQLGQHPERDTTFEIYGSQAGRLNLGCNTTITGYVDPSSYAQGYAQLCAPGQPWKLSGHGFLKADSGKTQGLGELKWEPA